MTRTHAKGPRRVFDALTDIEIVTDSRTAHETESLVQFRGRRNARANARLMAAAPELLDAPRDLLERDRAETADSGFTDDEMTWLEDASRVIRKATGQ